MRHYCIFELVGKNYRFVDEYPSRDLAIDMADSMNNFLTASERKKGVRFVVRILEEFEFQNLRDYNPFSSCLVRRCVSQFYKFDYE